MNIQIRKFYDTAAPIVAGAADRPSIAALMAKEGVKSDNGAAMPLVNKTEVKEEPIKDVTPTPAATANEVKSSEPAKPELPKPSEEQKQVEPQKEITPAKVPTWQETIKSQQPDEVLKALGLDDKVVGLSKKIAENPKMAAFFQHWEDNKGDVTKYLQELTTDYKTMPPEEVMRHQLRVENPKATPKQLDILYKNEVIKAYKLDSEDDEEREEGRQLMELKAEKHRDTFMAAQDNYLLPKPQEQKAPTPDTQAEAAKQELEDYKVSVNDDPYTKDIFSTNKFPIGDGEDKFLFPVEPQSVTAQLFDKEKWAKSMFKVQVQPDGTERYVPDIKKQMLLGLVAEYGEKVFTEHAKHFKSLGGKKVIEPMDNAKKPDGSSPSPSEVVPKTPAEAMAKKGQLISGE